MLPVTRQQLDQLSARVAHRDRSLKFLQISFEKMVGDDQRLDGLTSITAARRDRLIGRRLYSVCWLNRTGVSLRGLPLTFRRRLTILEKARRRQQQELDCGHMRGP